MESAARPLRPANPLRLDQMRQTLRSFTARRGRETVAWLAIGGTLAAMFVTANQVRLEWEQRRLAAERAVRDHLTTAAVLIGTEAARMSGLELRALLWPVLGTNGSPNPWPLSLDEFARAGAGQFAAMNNDRGAAQAGYFRLERRDRGEWTAELHGALATDSIYARAVLDEVRRWTDRVNLDRPGAGIGIIRPDVRAIPFVVGMAPERGLDGRAIALFGVAYARTVALRTHVGHVLHGGSLLPAAAAEPSDSTKGVSGTVDNAALAVRLLYANGSREAVSSAATDDAVRAGLHGSSCCRARLQWRPTNSQQSARSASTPPDFQRVRTARLLQSPHAKSRSQSRSQSHLS